MATDRLVLFILLPKKKCNKIELVTKKKEHTTKKKREEKLFNEFHLNFLCSAHSNTTPKKKVIRNEKQKEHKTRRRL